MNRSKGGPQVPRRGHMLPEGCRLVAPGLWAFDNGTTVEDTGRNGSRRYRCEDTAKAFDYARTRTEAFLWASEEEAHTCRYSPGENPAGPDVLTALKMGASTLPEIAKRAGYSESCTYYTLRKLLAAGAIVRARVKGTRSPPPFAYSVAA